jgi:hypothetical protein
MTVKKFSLAEKIGIIVLAFSLIFVPVAFAAEPSAQGNPGPGGTEGLSELQVAAIAAAAIAGIVILATSLTDSDTQPTATHQAK